MTSCGRIVASLIFPLITKPKSSPYLRTCLSYNGRKFVSQYAKLLTVTDSIKTSSLAQPSQDHLMQKLNNASSSDHVLKLIGAHHSIMSCSHVLEALQTLTSLLKRETSPKVKQDIINRPEFGKLCQRLKVHSRALALHENIRALKAMCLLKVPSTSPIVQILLNLLRHRVNDLVPGQIVYIDTLLSDMERSPLLEALKIALPMIFEAKLQSAVADEDTSPSYLSDLLSYASQRNISTEGMQKILQSLYRPETLENLEVRAAQSLLISLCNKRMASLPIKDSLIKRCLEIISNSFHHCSKFELDAITTGISKACSGGYNQFYDEEFIDAYVNYIIRTDVGLLQAVWISRKLTKMNHANIALLDYIAKKVEASPKIVEDGSAALLICMIAAFSHANYKPKNWDVIEEAVLKNDLLKVEKIELPWLKFSIELASLGCYSSSFLSKIFQKDFLEKFLSREYNMIDKLQLLLLTQAVKTLYPSYDGPFPPEEIMKEAADINGKHVDRFALQSSLEKGLGGPSYVHRGLRTKMGHFIDYVVVMRKGGYPVALNLKPSNDFCIEDLSLPSDSFVIAILLMPASSYAVNCQRMKGVPSLMIKTLEALNYCVLPISHTSWIGMPDSEKIPYLMQAIKLKCENQTPLEVGLEGAP